MPVDDIIRSNKLFYALASEGWPTSKTDATAAYVLQYMRSVEQ